MVTWGIGSVVLNPSICPSICSTMINATRRADAKKEQDVLFDYTGIYVSENSLLSPVLFASRLLGGMVMSSFDPSSQSVPTGNLCPSMCSVDLAKAVAVTGCGTSLMGVLDGTFVEDYVTASMVCPVGFLSRQFIFDRQTDQ